MAYEEERFYTYSEIVVKVRDAIVEYFKRLVKDLIEVGESTRGQPVLGKLAVSRVTGVEKEFRRIGVVDGGSNVIPLNVGYIGIVSSIGILLEDNQVVERIVADPVIVPSDPHELEEYESANIVHGIVDKIREALVFETAVKVLNKDIDLLVIDGPLVPYGALAKRLVNTRSERDSWLRYRGAVLELHRRSAEKGTNTVGFVKRPRSKYIARLMNLKGFDHVILSRILNPGEYCPEPPLDLHSAIGLFHDPHIAEIVKEIKPKTTYLRLTLSGPPNRVDLGYLEDDYREVLLFLYNTRTREGIPYVVIKADEEAKITRKLVKELYEDALHECIVSYVKTDQSLLVPLLPEYGGLQP